MNVKEKTYRRIYDEEEKEVKKYLKEIGEKYWRNPQKYFLQYVYALYWDGLRNLRKMKKKKSKSLRRSLRRYSRKLSKKIFEIIKENNMLEFFEEN